MTVSPKPDLFLTRKSTSTSVTLYLRNHRRGEAQFSSFEILKILRKICVPALHVKDKFIKGGSIWKLYILAFSRFLRNQKSSFCWGDSFVWVWQILKFSIVNQVAPQNVGAKLKNWHWHRDNCPFAPEFGQDVNSN